MKFPCLNRSKSSKKASIETAPVRHTLHNTVADLVLMPQSPISLHSVASFHDSGSRDDEIYLDSQAWLDSDCEDFLSVNGDLTPCCANTPIHESSFIQPDKPDKKKKTRLVELFDDSFGTETGYSDSSKPAVRNKLEKDEKLVPHGQCCLPNLVRNFSFNEKKKRPKPDKNIAG